MYTETPIRTGMVRLFIITSGAFLLGMFQETCPAQDETITQCIRDFMHEDEKKREAAIEKLVEIGEPAVPALLKTLRWEIADHRLKQEQSKAVWRALGTKGVPSLGSSAPESAAARALERIGKPAVPGLLALLEEEDEYLCSQAARSLGAIGPVTDAVTPALVKALKKDNDKLGFAAARALKSFESTADPLRETLLEELKDSNIKKRMRAAIALGRLGPRTVELDEPLVMEKDGRKTVFMGSMEDEDGPTRPALVEALRDESIEVRLAAAGAMRSISPKTKSEADALIRALQDENKDLRNTAAAALGRMVDSTYVSEDLGRQVVGTLCEALGLEPDEAIRKSILHDLEWATRSLARRGSAASMNEIIRAFGRSLRKDESESIRAEAARAFQKIDENCRKFEKTLTRLDPDKQAFETCTSEMLFALGEALEDDSVEVRDAALTTLTRLRWTASVGLAAFLKALKDTDAGIRRRAAKLIHEMKTVPGEALPHLNAALLDEDEQVAKYAALAISRLGRDAEEAVPNLMKALEGENLSKASSFDWNSRDRDGSLRSALAEALGNIGKPAKEAAPLLLERMKDKNDRVRLSCGWALGRIDPENNGSAIPVLIDGLKHENEENRKLAAEGLRYFGRAPVEEHLPRIEELLRDPMVRVNVEKIKEHLGLKVGPLFLKTSKRLEAEEAREEERSVPMELAVKYPRVSGFILRREETFSCGGQKNVMAIYRHRKTGLEFVLIPGSSFRMGNPESMLDPDSNEGPVHLVSIKSLLLCRTECTQMAWDKIGGEDNRSCQGAGHPIDKVSWMSCVSWCREAGLRLPSEAEWEYACRAGLDAPYCYGEDRSGFLRMLAGSKLNEYAWYSNNSGNVLHRAGQRTPNAFGLFDMHGNVWEWCQDTYHDSYDEAPLDGSPWEKGKEMNRIIRGGSIHAPGYLCDAYTRRSCSSRSWVHATGFRPAASIMGDWTPTEQF